jgi:cell division transport system permease protein
MADRTPRARGRDPLGLKRAMADRLLPGLVAAMALLAALAMAGANAAATMASRWEGGAAAAMMVQLPRSIAVAPAAARLAGLPGVAEAIPLDHDRLAALLRPWLGDASGLPLPGMIELRLASLGPASLALPAAIEAAIPGAQVEAHGVWVARLSALARSLQALAWLVLALVAGVAAAMVAVATRAGIAARRATILILHDMGATDGTIARRFAGRIAWLAGLGAVLGAAAAAPLLWLLGGLAAPLLGDTLTMPWPALAALPPAAAGIAWATAHATLRLWLRSLP